MCPAFEVRTPLGTRPGTGSAIHLISVAKAYPRHNADRDCPIVERTIRPTINVDTTTRNPLFLFLLFGLFWLR